MMKSSFSKIDWHLISCIGFDLDGTLYDEGDFISQVYRDIAFVICGENKKIHEEVFCWMMNRWKDKGSSYAFIFEECLDIFNLRNNFSKQIIETCLEIFRNYNPKLELRDDIRGFLDKIVLDYDLFIITDGKERLQRKKIEALGLDKWFDNDKIFITGAFGKNYEKPSKKILEKMSFIDVSKNMSRVLFVGDRQVDQDLALNTGFTFVSSKTFNEMIKK